MLKKISEHPEYKTAADKLTALSLERNKLEREIEALENGLSRSDRTPLDVRAESLLSGGVATLTAVAPSPVELAEKRRNLRAHERAIEMQRQRVASLEAHLSREATTSAMADYRRLMVNQARAAVQLAAAIKAEQDFLDDFRNVKGYSFFGGSAFGFRTFTFDTDDRLHTALASLAEWDLIDPREDFLNIPAMAAIRPYLIKAAATHKQTTKQAAKAASAAA